MAILNGTLGTRQVRVFARAEAAIVCLVGLVVVANADGALPVPRDDTGDIHWELLTGTGDYRNQYSKIGEEADFWHPGSRERAMSWADNDGNIWLFGGYGFSSAWEGYMGDLWKYDVAASQWTLVAGPHRANEPGKYSEEILYPGVRYGSASWSDTQGDLWLFGGWGVTSSRVSGYLNDLWRFDVSESTWELVGGTGDYLDESGMYNGPVLHPGSRWETTVWADGSGMVWVFGGVGYGTTGDDNYRLNDLWRLDTTTRAWSQISGSGDFQDENSVVTGELATPGSRNGAAGWMDGDGNLWLFGGQGYDDVLNDNEYLNDLWKYDTATMQWVMVAANNTPGSQHGVYTGATEWPGARQSGAVWVDGGYMYLFGGTGYAAAGEDGWLNDLWRYSAAGNVWEFLGGNTTIDAHGVYAGGAVQPGGRRSAVAQAVAENSVLVFGGAGFGESGGSSFLNDLLRLTLPGPPPTAAQLWGLYE